LGQLCCVQDDYENFVHYSFHNEIFWCGEHLYSSHRLDNIDFIHFLAWMQILSCSSSLHRRL
jgi:hypothetical protein